MLLVYPRGVRIIVHTANLIYVDWNNKSQGLWMQDFPWKDQMDVKKGHEFESDLIDYLSVLKVLLYLEDVVSEGMPSFLCYICVSNHINDVNDFINEMSCKFF